MGGKVLLPTQGGAAPGLTQEEAASVNTMAGEEQTFPTRPPSWVAVPLVPGCPTFSLSSGKSRSQGFNSRLLSHPSRGGCSPQKGLFVVFGCLRVQFEGCFELILAQICLIFLRYPEHVRWRKDNG